MFQWIKIVSVMVLLLSFIMFFGENVHAAEKVMWCKTELKVGQVGKVTILADVPLVKLYSDSSISTIRMLKKADEYRIYQYKGTNGGLYGVGASSFVQKYDVKVSMKHLLKIS